MESVEAEKPTTEPLRGQGHHRSVSRQLSGTEQSLWDSAIAYYRVGHCFIPSETNSHSNTNAPVYYNDLALDQFAEGACQKQYYSCHVRRL